MLQSGNSSQVSSTVCSPIACKTQYFRLKFKTCTHRINLPRTCFMFIYPVKLGPQEQVRGFWICPLKWLQVNSKHGRFSKRAPQYRYSNLEFVHVNDQKTPLAFNQSLASGPGCFATRLQKFVFFLSALQSLKHQFLRLFPYLCNA